MYIYIYTYIVKKETLQDFPFCCKHSRCVRRASESSVVAANAKEEGEYLNKSPDPVYASHQFLMQAYM